MTYHQRFSALCNHNYFPRLFSFQIFYLVYMMHFIFPVFSLITTQFTAIRFQSAVDCSSPFCNNGNDGRYHIETQIGGKTVTLGGMCKGSGMIHPNMCTMLGFVTTDVKISKEMLQKCVSADVVDSFNMISVDGDTSTNDTLLVLANGMAGNEEITTEGEDYDNFCKALHEITTFLAKKMAGDGEGATALFETKVINAVSKEDARTLAKSVICSSLTKAAIFGHDANWGRILCALGYSGAKFDPENVDLYFESKSGKIHIFGNGVACDYSEEEATKILSDPEVTALVDMHMGEAEATAWGCDLSYDYVKINADYRS